MNKSRKWLFRAGALLLLILVALLMLWIGRGHTVYFDNKTIEHQGVEYKPPYKVVVRVNGEQVAKLNARERGMATWIGQNFKMELEITWEKKGEAVVRSFTQKLPYNMDGIVLNLPALLNDFPEEVYLSEFVPVATEAEEVEEEIITSEFELSDL